MRARILAAAALVALAATGAAPAKGWETRPAQVSKGETSAFSCSQDTGSLDTEGRVCLILSCGRGAYRGSIYYRGGAIFKDSMTVMAGGKTVTVPLGPAIPDALLLYNQFTGNIEAFAALLTEKTGIRIVSPELPNGFDWFSPKGGKAQLARINKACGFLAP